MGGRPQVGSVCSCLHHYIHLPLYVFLSQLTSAYVVVYVECPMLLISLSITIHASHHSCIVILENASNIVYVVYNLLYLLNVFLSPSTDYLSPPSAYSTMSSKNATPILSVRDRLAVQREVSMYMSVFIYINACDCMCICMCVSVCVCVYICVYVHV
jgi:hypothetical protein